MVKFSAEMMRFLKSEDELTWEVPPDWRKTVLANGNVTVSYHPLLVKTAPPGNTTDSDNVDTCLVATFSKCIAVTGKLYMKEASLFLAAPSSLEVYRLSSNDYLDTRNGFWYQTLAEGQTALRKAREMLKAGRIPDCETGDFDSLFCVAYVEAPNNRGWIRYRPLVESWEELTIDDDTTSRTEVGATTFVPRSRKRPAPREQEASTSGISAKVPPAPRDQEARVPDASPDAPELPHLPAKRAKSSNRKELMPQTSRGKNNKQRLKNKIKSRMAKFYPHLEWSFENLGAMSTRYEVNTEPSGEEDQRKMMEIKTEIQALFEELKPGSSIELPNPKLP